MAEKKPERERKTWDARKGGSRKVDPKRKERGDHEPIN